MQFLETKDSLRTLYFLVIQTYKNGHLLKKWIRKQSKKNQITKLDFRLNSDRAWFYSCVYDGNNKLLNILFQCFVAECFSSFLWKKGAFTKKYRCWAKIDTSIIHLTCAIDVYLVYFVSGPKMAQLCHIVHFLAQNR